MLATTNTTTTPIMPKIPTPTHNRRPAIKPGLLTLLVLCAAYGIALGACGGAQADVPPMEQRAQDLNKTIMCPVCPGESIDQSQVALAVQMRGIVDEKLADGWSDEQIRQFFVERYGPSVLLLPPTQGVSLAVWLIPPLAVAAAAAIFILALRNMRRRPQNADADEPDEPLTSAPDTVSDTELQQYYDRIDAAISDDKK